METKVGSTAAVRLLDRPVERPANRYDGPPTSRNSAELFSAIADHLHPGGTFLDIGCGDRDQAAAAEHYGLQYVGVDDSSHRADILADAHTLPFADASFDIVFSYAVLEHLYNPFLAVREMARVMNPGGVLVTTVSQGEPFHESYFHHTAYGVLAVTEQAGLNVTRLWNSYDTLHGLAVMGRYPKVARLLLESLHRLVRAIPILSPRKALLWSQRDRQVDALHRAAGICFVAVKSP